jgi:DNA-binding PadR family transcriptional regulator
MNPGRQIVRLIALSLLDEGPMHGHQIRREAELRQVQDWPGVRVGSLYGALHRLEREGLIESVREEREGRRPTRTVYAITEPGRDEVARLRREALLDSTMRSLPVDVALAFGSSMDRGELQALLDARRGRLASLLDDLIVQREQLERRDLHPAGRAVLRHWELRVEAELRWHDEIAAGGVQPVGTSV